MTQRAENSLQGAIPAFMQAKIIELVKFQGTECTGDERRGFELRNNDPGIYLLFQISIFR